MSLARVVEADYLRIPAEEDEVELPSSPQEMAKLVERLETQMREAAQKFEFEKAATLRDRVKSLRTGELIGPVQAG
jgi:excinuclease ABC subunit B